MIKARGRNAMLVARGWKDYQILDTGYGEKVEQWGDIVLRRPDPQIIWPGTYAAGGSYVHKKILFYGKS
jgi:hypothetical protein